MLSVYPAFRSVECDMAEVRMVGKRRIDRMYYLDTQQQKRYKGENNIFDQIDKNLFQNNRVFENVQDNLV